MRFKITFNRISKNKMLPMDYQYYISAWIYKVICNADPQFSKFLHTIGYKSGNKHFKLFNYSPLDFGKPILWKEKSLFEINQNSINLKISFQLEKAAESFILGLFKEKHLYIGNQFNGLELIITNIEKIPEFKISETIRYRAISPVVVSTLSEGSKYPIYLNPDNSSYNVLLQNNLVNKFNSIPGNNQIESIYPFNFELLNTPRSKLITIKTYSKEQCKIRGYVFDFQLTSQKNIHALIENIGIGEKNSMGFGWVEPICK